MKGKNYSYNVNTQGICYIWTNDGKFIGSVFNCGVDEWKPSYEEGVKYLPINSALKLLGYMACQDVEIE